MKLLVIGSKGFIGSHALRYFSGMTSHECWGADILEDTTNKNYYQLNPLCVEYDELFKQQFNICINCSGAASVPDSFANPYKDFSLNTVNVLKILDAIRTHSPRCSLINLSSAAVYGNPERLPIPETATLAPTSPYGCHKLYSERICSEYSKYFGVGTCSLRIFSAYGPGLRKQILWDITQKARQNDTVRLFGTGMESRDFIFIDDIVRAIETVIYHGLFSETVFNVATGVETRIRDLAQELLSEIGYTGSLEFSGNDRPGDPINWRADISALSLHGFKPSIDIHQGVRNYASWLKEEKSL